MFERKNFDFWKSDFVRFLFVLALVKIYVFPILIISNSRKKRRNVRMCHGLPKNKSWKDGKSQTAQGERSVTLGEDIE